MEFSSTLPNANRLLSHKLPAQSATNTAKVLSHLQDYSELPQANKIQYIDKRAGNMGDRYTPTARNRALLGGKSHLGDGAFQESSVSLSTTPELIL